MSLSHRRLALGFAVSSLLLLAGPLRAQPSTDVTGLERRLREFKNPSVSELLRGLEAADPANDNHKKALETEARLIAARLYSSDYHKPYNLNPDRPGDVNPMSIHKTFIDYESDLTALTKKKEETRVARQLFAEAVLKQGKEVLDWEKKNQRRPIVLMNVARMMARTAELGQGETADYLADILRDPPAGNQGAQYWAARGLRDLLATAPDALSPEQAEKTALALCDFIDKQEKFALGVPAAEIDGYRTLRREAVRALALTRLPAYGGKARPAWVLLKVMANSGMVPEARMDERAEAAVGLAHLRPKEKDEDYQPDYAAQQLVAFVGDFADFAQKEGQNSGLPLKVLAARLGDELKGFQDQLGDPYVKKAVDTARAPLERIEKGQPVTPETLRDWVADKDNQAPVQALFKSDPKTTVAPAAPAPPGK